MMSSGGYTTIDNQKVSGSVPAASGSDHVSVKFADSNLQTFPPLQAQGKISAVFRPPSDADDSFSKPAAGSSSSEEAQAGGGWMRTFTVAAYKPYFDVETSDVLERIRESLFPFRGSFTEKTTDNPDLPSSDVDDTFSKPAAGSARSEEPQAGGGWMRTFTVAAYKPYFNVLERIRESMFPFRGSFTEKTTDNPDLYGPFWICTTLIFVAAAIGTFVTYLAHKLQKKEWDYDINLVTWSAGLFYGYVTIVPLGLYIILKYFSAPAGLVQLWCLYGYSLFVFIPASCLSVVPLEIFRWVIAGVAGFMSATFVALNLRNHIKSAGERWFLIVAGIFLLQLGLAVVLKMYLFTITVGKD